TIVYDLEKNRVVWVGKGKAKASLQRFFDEELSDYQKSKIKWGCCDISKGYINALKENCPGIQIVLDKFHIVKALNEALDSVRKDEWRQLSGDDRKILKGMRWLLYKHSNNRSKKETRRINKVGKSNRRIHRAWVLKDEFELLWEYKAKWAAERFLKNWITKALRSRIEAMKKFARTMREYFDLIIAYVDKKITNAAAEGMNRVIKQVKKQIKRI
ncbi:MAG: transposase, partial [Bacteroidales bacterium]|nr:transposase [Bacteroidales bacterium]